jgi:hypothetical protein
VIIYATDYVQFDATDGRLPRNVVPVHYNLEIKPNIALEQPPFPFDGTVQIYILCVEATNSVVLNYKDLGLPSETAISIVGDPNSPITAPSPIYLSVSIGTVDFRALRNLV